MSAYLDELIELGVLGDVEQPTHGWLDTAVSVACDVRDDTRRAGRTLRTLDEQQLRALCVTLAALVPDDRPLTHLTAWMRTPLRSNQHKRVPLTRSWSDAQLRKAHSRYNSALKHAKRVGAAVVFDELTREGEREYNRRRKSAQAARAA